MALRQLIVPLLLVAGLVSVKPANAEDPKTPPTKSEATGAKKRGVDAKQRLAYWKLIRSGDEAFLNGNPTQALRSFEEAAELIDTDAFAYSRIAEAHLAAGKTSEAEAALNAGLEREAPPPLRAKLLFLVASVQEKLTPLGTATSSWNAYETFVENNPSSKGYPKTATDRVARVEKRLKDERDYAVVKKRAQERQAQREKEAVENAQKDQLNR